MKVLIADDHASSRKLLRVTLAGEGHEVIEAADGEEALEKLEAAPVDAVISDILMPRMDGYRFCYETRRHPGLQNMPIIIYSSTYTSPSEEALAMQMGADRFLRKPASARVILQALSDVTTQPRRTSVRPLPKDELGVLKQFNERLVQKLEEKNVELQEAQAKLSAAYDKLERSEIRFRELVELAPIGIFQTAPDGLLGATNTAFVHMLGYSSPQELIGLELARDILVDAEDRQKLLPRSSRPGKGSELRLKRRDGTVMWVQADGRAVMDSAGRILRHEVFTRDVTDRRRAEEALRTSEARKRAVLEAALDPIITIDEDGRVIEVNPATERTFGFPASEMLGRDLAEMIIPPALRAAHHSGLERQRSSGETRVIGKVLEMPALRASGEEFPVELFISRVEVEGTRHFVGYIRDLTKRKNAEKGMRRSEERFRRLFESNTIGIAITDLNGATIEANDAYLDMLGYTREEVLAGKMRWDQMTPSEHRGADQTAVEALRSTGVAPPWEKELLRKDGTRVPVIIGIAMLEASEANRCIAYVLDLSKSRQLEKQLWQAQKMEAVGQLAGGVAHDFNNLLTAILGFTELVKARLGADTTALDELDEVRKAGERAAALTRQLLAFSRRQVLEPRVLDLNAIVGEMEKMLRRLIGEDVDLVTTLDPSLGNVRADAGEIEQVIVNLAVNSRDAMPRGGRITIETSNVNLDEAYSQQHVPVRPGRYIMLAVSDTGMGMDAETQARIFEPFFTTKGSDRGTGLGLSTVYGIVKQSGGYIWVYSEPGGGTTLKIYLPEVDEAADRVRLRVEAAPVGGPETVLLVEDEAPVRKLARIALEKLGYTVLEAANAATAQSIATAHSGPIQLLLTDVVMPDMGGADLAARIQEARPETRVLFMSGYTDDAIVRHKVLERGTRFLQKPFTPASLAAKVREALA